MLDYNHIDFDKRNGAAVAGAPLGRADRRPLRRALAAIPDRVLTTPYMASGRSRSMGRICVGPTACCRQFHSTTGGEPRAALWLLRGWNALGQDVRTFGPVHRDRRPGAALGRAPTVRFRRIWPSCSPDSADLSRRLLRRPDNGLGDCAEHCVAISVEGLDLHCVAEAEIGGGWAAGDGVKRPPFGQAGRSDPFGVRAGHGAEAQ